ncbi:hypothetical protein TESG_01586 [Trichophyton tonsurans CBS 112818]|uniref:HECT-type E3 ubiquitin transferase n=1 Tax=Trichophyton tonsurans (strain CBS 112818) TaxID=647933 RepID=F2RR80_TRIT1|nr:hypothetical protein TESG_01586 [Trichophyton tonsurans CBS 112818]
MTRLQGAAHGNCAAERTAYHHARLPSGAPEVISRHTVNVSDPSRVLSWAKEERQRTFNHLVKRYKAQLLYGCQEPNCMTPTCLSFRRRNTKAPLRRFTDLSARTVACYLASQDDAESGLCHYPSAAVSTSLAPDVERKTRQSVSYVNAESARSQSHQRSNSTLGNRPRRPSGSPPTTLDTAPAVLESSSKTRKDPKSFTQNLFDTLPLRMVEWLPLMRTTFYGAKPEDETSSAPTASLLENQPPNNKRPSHSTALADTASSSSKSISSSNQSTPSVNHTSSTLEVKVPGHPVKRLSLEPLESRKQSQRSSITDERSKGQRKRSKNASVNSTPTAAANTSQSLPSPPALRHRSQKHRRIADGPSKSNAHVSWGDQNSDAASITVVVLLALSSTIPHTDTRTWEAIRHMRASGSVMPDSMMRTFSKLQTQTIIETSDRFEHDLALRLLNRLARVISTRLALHEVSKTKVSHVTDFTGNDKCELIEQIIFMLQRFHNPESSGNNNRISLPGNRKTTTPMVVVEWLRGVLLKEWDGKPELSKASAAGGALQLLSFLYRDRTKLGLLPEDFHTPFFADRLDPIDMPTEWVDLLYNNRTMHLLSCSFIFPPSALVTYFRAINHATMSKSFENAVIASKHVTSMAFSGTISVDDNLGLLARLRTGLTMFFVISVRRDHALEDALNQLWRRERRELLRPLKVRMGMDDGEEGVDQGGVQQEFFRIAMLEAMNPAFGMFTVDSRSGTYYFQPCSFEPLYKFELLGLLVSLAIYNGVTLPVDFPIALYRRLLGLKVKTTDHIRVGWPELAKGLDELLAWEDGDVGDIFMRTYEFSFNAFGTVITVDMERTDKNEPWPAPERYTQWEKTKQKLNDQRVATRRLSNQNGHDGSNSVSMLKEYSTDSRQHPRDTHVIGILKGAPSRLPRHQSVRPQYEAFQRGFFTCLDRTAFVIFNPER